MPLVYTICTAVYGNGPGTAGMALTMVRRRMVARGPQAIARSACCAAAPGATNRTFCVRPSVTGIRRLYETRAAVFVLSRAAERREVFPCVLCAVSLCLLLLPLLWRGLGGGFLAFFTPRVFIKKGRLIINKQHTQ
jgi:hypothetical protein